MKIGVYGSAAGELPKGTAAKARQIGREIAKKGHVLVTGGCLGLPYESVLGAHECGGECIAYSPATSLEDHANKYAMPRKGFSEFIFVPKEYEHADNEKVCLKYRNVSSVAAADAAVIIRGRIGTLNEFTIAYDLGKRIGVLENTGGITEEAIFVLLRNLRKDTGARVIFEEKPVGLVERLTAEKHYICNHDDHMKIYGKFKGKK